MDVSEYARACPQFYDERVPPLLAELLAGAPASASRTLLDAGCGDGGLARALLDSGLLRGRTLIACDASAERVGLLAGLAENVVAIEDDVERLSRVPSGSVDVYISSQVIEHVDDERMVEAMARVTHPGSRLYLSTVLKRWYGWYFHRQNGAWALDPTHLREYRTEDELLRKFPRERFRLRASTQTPLAYPAADFLLRRLRAPRSVYARSGPLRALRRLALPIPGYRTWELVLERT
jgi:2-polyprenyl-3-methyl-5-hydroxy-6-metoxy-1,4-benzoquinol methylase